MFGLGPTELIIILAIALIIFGPRRLPEMAREIGKAINSMKRASMDIEDSVKKEVLGEGDDEEAPGNTTVSEAEAKPVSGKKAKKNKAKGKDEPEVG